jgi:hypothetical protein
MPSSMQIHPTQAVNTARQALHLHPSTWTTTTQHMQIRYTARRPPIGAAGVAVVLPFVPCHAIVSPVASYTVGLGLADVYGFGSGLDYIRPWRSFMCME